MIKSKHPIYDAAKMFKSEVNQIILTGAQLKYFLDLVMNTVHRNEEPDPAWHEINDNIMAMREATIMLGDDKLFNLAEVMAKLLRDVADT